MQLAKVIGRATATVKHPSLAGARLLVVQPVAADRTSPDGNPLLCVDQWGARSHDLVMINSDGVEVQTMLGDPNTPVRYSVLGICD